MDVTCDRCGTEYEFEEALVSTRGTTVKCTHCGHLFKVYKPDAPAEPGAALNPWTIRRSDGSIHRLSSLADLTRLIEEGAFGREDELSRTSKAWKRLGDIEELNAFFARAQSAYVRPRRATGAPTVGVRKRAPAVGEGRGNEPAAASGDTVVGRIAPSTGFASGPAGAGAAAPAGASDASAGSARPAPDKTAEAKPPSRPRRQTVPPAAQPRPAPAPAGPQPAPSADDDMQDTTDTEPTTVHVPRKPREIFHEPLPETYEPFARRKPAVGIWVFVILTTLGVFATWLAWPLLFEKRVVPIAPTKTDPAVAFLTRADAAFETHRERGFEEAIQEYLKAQAFHDSDPHILSSISRVYAVWAQELLFEASARERELGDSADVDARAQLIALHEKARDLGEQAKRHAETAARKNPGNEEAEIALSDALRLTGNLVSARSSLDRARTTESSPSSETLRVAALLAIAEAGGDLRAGLPLASQAVVQDPESIRARLLLARCLVADGDLQGAQFQLAVVSRRDRDHPGVLAIEKELTRVHAPSAPPTRPDAGPSEEGVEEAAPLATKNNERDKQGERGKESKTGDSTLSHEDYIARGQRFLESGQVTNAKRMFEQALFIRPSSPEAHSGLGFVALEKGRPKLAVQHFLEAKRDGHGDAWIGLGDAYRRLNRPRDALRAYQTYVTEFPRGPQLSIARAQIERLSEDSSASTK